MNININIIDEFSRLIAFIRDETDTLQAKKDLAGVKKNQFRLKNLSIALSILKKVPFEITLDNYMDLKDFGGIGKGTLDRIKIILDKGQLDELGEFVDSKKEKKHVIELLEEVVGIGRANAIELYEKGITSVEDLKNKVKKGTITVNDKIKLGLKYHGKYYMNIPRSEMDMYDKLLQRLIKKINKTLKLKDDEEYIVQLCGSYRREKPQSNDVDVLLSKKGTNDISLNHLERIVKKLKAPMKHNDMKPLLVDHMTDKKIKTKYMGFSKLKDNPIRRIDIRFISYDSYYSALLYFTGSGDFNKKMRLIAKEKGYKLSEYGLFDLKGNVIHVISERDIFRKLDMEYLPPRLR
jgi:DNA polymerase/3'-5' exonuclease PolX